jgi:hypothetical protein
VQVELLEREDELTADRSPLFVLPSLVPDRAGRRSLRRAAVVLLLGAGLALFGALLYAASVHAAPGNSDGATVILEGKALSGGNLTLRNWALSMDSFWLVDVPFYAVAVLLVGVKPQLLHLVPTIVALGVICVGAWIALSGRRAWAGVLAAGVVVVMLGLPSRALAANMLMGPLHVTTVLLCLLAFVALRRGSFNWSWLLAVGLLAAGMLGDMQSAVLGTVPVVLAGTVLALRSGSLRAGAPAVTAGLGSAVLAEAVRLVAATIGSFSIAGANPRASLHQMVLNLRGLLGYGAAVQGVGIRPFSSLSQPLIFEVAHALGLAVVLAGVSLATVAAFRASAAGMRAALARSRPRALAVRPAGRATSDEQCGRGVWFEDVLVFAFLGACAIYVALALVSSSVYERYLTAVVIFGAILAARLVGRVAEHAGTRRAKAALVAAASVVAAGYVFSFAADLTTPPPTQASSALVTYLSEHHLTSGIGDYWSSSIVTVESSDAIKVRPVTTEPGTQYLGRYMRQTTASWYQAGFEFFVYNTALPWNSVDARTAAASFGPPQHVASIGTFRVLTWGHELSLSGTGQYVKYVSAS